MVHQVPQENNTDAWQGFWCCAIRPWLGPETFCRLSPAEPTDSLPRVKFHGKRSNYCCDFRCFKTSPWRGFLPIPVLVYIPAYAHNSPPYLCCWVKRRFTVYSSFFFFFTFSTEIRIILKVEQINFIGESFFLFWIIRPIPPLWSEMKQFRITVTWEHDPQHLSQSANERGFPVSTIKCREKYHKLFTCNK